MNKKKDNKKEIINKKSNFITALGSGKTLSADSDKINIMNIEDLSVMESSCWELIKGYAEIFGIEVDFPEELDLSTVKSVERHIIELFKNSGFKFTY